MANMYVFPESGESLDVFFPSPAAMGLGRGPDRHDGVSIWWYHVIPQLDGLFHGKSEDKMDDNWVYHGVPPS